MCGEDRAGRFRDTDFGCVLPEHLPDNLSPSRSPVTARAVNWPEHVTNGDAGWRRPSLDRD
jgi:hypothetical protein